MLNFFNNSEIHPYSKVFALIGSLDVNGLLVEPNLDVLKHFHPLFEPIIGVLDRDGFSLFDIDTSDSVKRIESIFSISVSKFVSVCQKICYGYELDRSEKEIAVKISEMIDSDNKLTVLIGNAKDIAAVMEFTS